MGSVNCDGLVYFSINQSGHEDGFDTQFDNFATLKPLFISSLSLSEGHIDLINYGGDYIPSSCRDSSNFALGVLGFVTPLRNSPVKKGYFLRSCSKGNKDFSVKHDFDHGPYGIFPSYPVFDGFPPLVIFQGLVVTRALRAEYAPSGLPL